ncbi:MAG: ABC transporter permease [Candidatus Heritagella sp.]
MYLLKNAWRNVIRFRGRSILIGVIVLVVALASCLALSIRAAAEQTRASTLEGMNITATISVNRTAWMQQEDGEEKDQEEKQSELENLPRLTLEELETYAQAESVKSFTYVKNLMMNAGEDGLQAVGASDREEPGGPAGHASFLSGESGDFTVSGYSDADSIESFRNGTSAVTEGNLYLEGAATGECLISEELSTLNDLWVGDTITLENPQEEGDVYTLTISGIYSTEEGSSGSFASTSQDPANIIYVSAETVEAIEKNSQNVCGESTDEETGETVTTALTAGVTGTYSFASEEDYQAFPEQAEELGLDTDTYTVSSSDMQSFENSLSTLENLSQFALYFLVVILAIGAVVLIVVHVFSIRERKYEIGVLMSLGMRRSRICLQFVAETAILSVLCVAVGTAAGSLVSVPVTNALLQAQVDSQQAQEDALSENLGRRDKMDFDWLPELPGETSEEIEEVTQVSVAADWTVVLQLLGISVLLTIAASAVGLICVARFEPLEILANRD